MRLLFTTLPLVLVFTYSGICSEFINAPLNQLVNSPKSFIGQKVLAVDLRCVDNPGGRFICLQKVGGQFLRLEVYALGGNTSTKNAQLLAGDCRGTANLIRGQCSFDVQLEVTSGYRDIEETPNGKQPVTVIVGSRIDMLDRKRR